MVSKVKIGCSHSNLGVSGEIYAKTRNICSGVAWSSGSIDPWGVELVGYVLITLFFDSIWL